MNIFWLASKLAIPDQPAVALDKKTCVRTSDRWSACVLCVCGCPVGAIALDSPIALDEKKCVACGLCLRVCPTGAFSGDDGSTHLLNFVSRVPNLQAIELVCSRHRAAEQGSRGNATVIRMNHCLASLETALYLSLLSIPVSQIIVRLDACADCALGSVRGEIERALETAQQIIAARNETDRVIQVTATPKENSVARTVYPVTHPPVSRRDFLRVLNPETPDVTARLRITNDQPTTGKNPPLERRRLLNAIRQLQSADANWASASLQSQGFVSLSADDQCTACGVCARVCPTGAMRFTTIGDAQYALDCATADCTDCGVCLDVCEPEALHRAGAPTLADFISDKPQWLNSGSLKKCDQCGAKFAGHIEGSLCPICNFRKQNPFGSFKPRSRAAPAALAREASNAR